METAGHRSPKWEVIRSLQQVYGARKVRGCTIIDAPPFFESAGREDRESREKIDGVSRNQTLTLATTDSPRPTDYGAVVLTLI